MFSIVWFSIHLIEDIIHQLDINTKDRIETIVVQMFIEIEEVKIESQTPDRILVIANQRVRTNTPNLVKRNKAVTRNSRAVAQRTTRVNSRRTPLQRRK